MEKQGLIVRYLSHFYGEIEDEYGRTDDNWDMPVAFITLVLAALYWCVFAGMMVAPWHWIPIKITLGSMLAGFILSSFTGLKEKNHRLWALLYGTVLLPGFLTTVLLTHVWFGIRHAGTGLLRIQDGLLWLQDMLGGGAVRRFQERQQKKREQKDAQLKKLAEKVRVSGVGAYRAGAPACGECGQFLPEDEMKDDRSQRHASD